MNVRPHQYSPSSSHDLPTEPRAKVVSGGRDPCSSGTSQELLHEPTKIQKPNKNEDHERVREDPCHSDKREWLQEFRENLVDDRVPEHRDSHASSSHEVSLEPTRSHFPKDRNCDICLRTKITWDSCRKRIGTVVPNAENFGDLTTADHKVLSEGCKSRNNHQYAVVQDLATQWLQSCPCKTKTSQETQKNLQKVLEPTRKPKVIYTDNSLEFDKSCEGSFLESLSVNATQIRIKWDC